ncbi:hypothetical protein HDK77DRAFT_438945 [Phyllosticta capitalensis]
MARPIFLLGHSSVHFRREPSNKVFHFPKSGLFQRQALNQHSTPDPPSFSARISIRPIHLPIWTLSICSEYPRSTRPLESNLDHGLPLLSMRASHCKQGAFRSSILPKAFHLVIHSPHREQSSESVPSSSAHPRTDGTRPRACKRQHHKNERQEHKTTKKPDTIYKLTKKDFDILTSFGIDTLTTAEQKSSSFYCFSSPFCVRAFAATTCEHNMTLADQYLRAADEKFFAFVRSCVLAFVLFCERLGRYPLGDLEELAHWRVSMDVGCTGATGRTSSIWIGVKVIRKLKNWIEDQGPTVFGSAEASAGGGSIYSFLLLFT